MSSLYATVQAAEEFLQNGNDQAAQDVCIFAQDIISRHWPKDGESPPAICCFSIEGDMLWCHDRNRQPLYFAPITKQPSLCKACREDCRKRLATLAKILSRRKKNFTQPKNKKGGSAHGSQRTFKDAFRTHTRS